MCERVVGVHMCVNVWVMLTCVCVCERVGDVHVCMSVFRMDMCRCVCVYEYVHVCACVPVCFRIVQVFVGMCACLCMYECVGMLV